MGGPTIRQYVVVDRSLGMSAGKLAAQVAHASVAPLLAGTQRYVEEADAAAGPIGLEFGGSLARTAVDADVLAAWVRQGEPKIVLAVDGERALAALVNRAESRGLMEGLDFFCIRDACRTELTPDESGSRWTCVGFAPMDVELIAPVTGSCPSIASTCGPTPTWRGAFFVRVASRGSLSASSVRGHSDALRHL